MLATIGNVEMTKWPEKLVRVIKTQGNNYVYMPTEFIGEFYSPEDLIDGVLIINAGAFAELLNKYYSRKVR